MQFAKSISLLFLFILANISLLSAYAYQYDLVEDNLIRVDDTGSDDTLRHADMTALSPNVISNVKASIVKITSTDPQGNIFVGSGFVYDNLGHIATDYHLVIGKEKTIVTFADGSVFNAKLERPSGPPPPCGPIEIMLSGNLPRENLKPLHFADSKSLRTGDPVFAIINTNSNLASLVKAKITAIGEIIASENTHYGFPIADVIDTSSPLNASFYGGPLINKDGEVVGMNLYTSSWADVSHDHGIAVPSNTVKKVISSQIATGYFDHPWLGLLGNNTVNGNGIAIKEVVPGSPSFEANIKAGDIITRVDNMTVHVVDDLLNYIQRQKHVGDKIILTILRGADNLEFNLTLVPRPHIEYIF